MGNHTKGHGGASIDPAKFTKMMEYLKQNNYNAVSMRDPGNGISQTIPFDKGNYTISFDAVKRSGYEKTAAPLIVTIDGAPGFTLEPAKITKAWASYTSPVFPVTAGAHVLGFALGTGEGMDMLDNVALHYQK